MRATEGCGERQMPPVGYFMEPMSGLVRKPAEPADSALSLHGALEKWTCVVIWS